MGNYCFNSYNSKNNPPPFQITPQDFKSLYKFLKFPKNVSFIIDPTIFRIQHRSTGDFYILKRFTFLSEQELSDFITNLETIVELEHDHLLKIHHYVLEKNPLHHKCDDSVAFTLDIIIENFHHTLQDELILYTKAKQTFSEAEIKTFLTGLADALEFLQLKTLSFGNLRPSNIYITSKNTTKLMLLGKLPSNPNSEVQSVDFPSLWYMSPQMRNQISESLFPEKASTLLTMSRNESTPVACNPYKSDVFSLGLIILTMMSMKSVKGLNKMYCESIRYYRVVQCQGMYSSLLLRLVESMLKENEMARPDFLDLKQRILFDEYRESTRPSRLQSRTLEDESMGTMGTIEMKMMKNKSEVMYSRDCYYTESSEGELSILRDLTECSQCSEEEEEEKASPAVRSPLEFEEGMSPTKGYADTYDYYATDKLYKKKKMSEENGEEEDFVTKEEMVIEDERLLTKIFAKKVSALKKLVVALGDRQISKQTRSELMEVIGLQEHLTDLIVTLQKSKLGDEGLEMLCEGISKAGELSMCYLDFRKAKICNTGLQAFRTGLFNKTRLVQLGINLADNGLCQKGCQEISGWFESFKGMTSLALNLGGNKTGSEGLKEIGSRLVELKDLEILMLFFYTNEIEGKEGLEVVFESLKEMKKLKKMRLDLSSNLIGDEEMEVIVGFVKESEIGEVVIELKDNCVSEEGRKKTMEEIGVKGNVEVRF